MDEFKSKIFNMDDVLNYFKEIKNITIVKNNLIELRYFFNEYSIFFI